jgi:hypothetical protein
MDNRDSMPGKAAVLSSPPLVQTGSGAHPASYPLGTGGIFPWVADDMRFRAELWHPREA